jgi:hypothetical protein
MRALGWLVVLVVLASCAQIVPPTGGPRDETPPQLLSVSLPNKTTNFTSKSILMTFDEYVQLSDINNQLIVSPPLRERPDVRIRKKGVLLTFDETLLPDVTYTLNFGEGIKDFNEGNPAEVLYVFSTGDVLDSLTFSGRIVDAYTGEPIGGVRVMLYQDTATVMAPIEAKPYYFARSNKEGFYKFSYLAPGAYKLFALEEQNMNYQYDDPGERIAFVDSLITPGTPSDSLVLPTLYLSLPRDTSLYISSFDSDSSGFIRIQLNRAWDANGSMTVEDSTLRPIVYFKKPDSLFAWTEVRANREIEWYFASQTKSDTFDVRSFEVGKRALGLSDANPTTVPSERALSMRFPRPIGRIDTSLIRMKRDSLDHPLAVRMGDDPFSVRFEAEVVDGGKYAIELIAGAITSIEGWTCDTIRWNFSAHPADHYGKVMLDLSDATFEGDPIIQMYKKGKEGGEPDRVIRLGDKRSLVLDRVEPGTYRLRLIDDRNRNGKYDPANYLAGRQPERVYNLQEDINVRSNWDMEISWIIEQQP